MQNGSEQAGWVDAKLTQPRCRLVHVEQPDDAALIRDAINRMVSGLDPQSTYLSPAARPETSVWSSRSIGVVDYYSITRGLRFAM